MAYDGSVMDMVTQSPTDILLQHMDKVQICVALLPQFLAAVLGADWPDAERIYKDIKTFEHEADQLKAKARGMLRKDLFLPMAKSELLTLLRLQDGLANQTRDICGIMIGRCMLIPEAIVDDFVAFCQKVVDTCQQASDTLLELNNIFEAVFSKQAVEVIEQKFTVLETFETQTDQMQIDIRQKLYQVEQTLAPVEVLFLYKIINRFGQLADQAESVGQHLLLCVAD